MRRPSGSESHPILAPMSNANAWIDSGDGSTGIYCDADADNNLLQLKLKKPKAWKWELTTSRSSPNIAMPRIMLFDHEGNLLVDANQQVDDAVYRAETKPSRLISSQRQQRRKARKFSRDKSATTELDLDKLQPQDDEDTGLGSLDSADRNQWFRTLSNDSLRSKRNFNSFCKARRRPEENSCEIEIDSLQICEATDSNSRSQSPLPICEIIDDPSPQPEDIKDLEEELNIDAPWRRKLSLKTKNIESADDSDIRRSPLVNVPVILSDTEEPSERQYISKASWKPFHSNGCLNVKPPGTSQPLERRATSFKEVRFNVDPEVGGLKPKRRYRRSNSNGPTPNLTHSRSILERQSAMKCRLSSPEFETPEFQEFQMAPRYYLRTSRAGTLVVAEESVRNKRVRRRAPKTSSTENCLTISNSSSSLKNKGTLNSSLGDVCSQSQSVNNFGDRMKGQMESSSNGRRRKLVPIRRNKSDGNILPYSTSSEDEKVMNCDRKVNHRKNAIWRHKIEDVQKYIRSCE